LNIFHDQINQTLHDVLNPRPEVGHHVGHRDNEHQSPGGVVAVLEGIHPPQLVGHQGAERHLQPNPRGLLRQNLAVGSVVFLVFEGVVPARGEDVLAHVSGETSGDQIQGGSEKNRDKSQHL